jgi:hypothetical protein
MEIIFNILIMVGRAGIEPATTATSRRCHTTRPPAQAPHHTVNGSYKDYRTVIILTSPAFSIIR